MTALIRCANCGKTWTQAQLDPTHDFWGRVQPGEVVPIGQCPDDECGALCYPPSGYVYDLEHRLTTLRHVIAELVEWAAATGGWEAPVWERARRVLSWSDGNNASQHEEEAQDG